jgi:hypothetical protein
MKLYLKLPVPVAQVEYGERSGKRPDDSQCSMWENKGSVTYHLLFQYRCSQQLGEQDKGRKKRTVTVEFHCEL